MTANALRDWCRFSKAGSAYIEPGAPWQNPYVESFGSRLRDELLAAELFSCLAEARVVIEDWRQDYNERRPHSGLGMMTPTAFRLGYRTYLEAVSEHLSPLGGAEQWLAETTINNHQLSQQVDR
ncbi:MAG: transposase [Solirubrobacterales bacterium]|nr:transposase [Solirubrobacterales bacterium]